MEISVNQLVSESKKAVCGKGYDFGLALDIAKAFELLAIHKFDITSSIISFLTQDDAVHDRLLTTADELHVKGTSGALSVIGAMDLFLSRDFKKLTFDNLQNSDLSLGLIAMRQSPYFGSFALSTGAGLSDVLDRQTTLPSKDVSVVKTSYQAGRDSSWPARIHIGDEGYELLKAFAHKTYVPSSEASRAAGAGAGLTDND